MLQVVDLDLRYQEQHALRALEFTMQEGELISLIGPNGAGKSSLLKCLLGLEHPQGRILIEGRPLESLSRLERARVFSYVPQASQLKLPFTVEELVAQGRYPFQKPFSLPSKEDEAAIEGALEVTGAKAYRKEPLDRLSGGERQIALIAAALAQEARILLLDEALTYLDYARQKQILDCLQALHQEGQSILTVHHDLNHSLRLGGRALGLKGGSKVFDGPTTGLLEKGRLEEIFGIPFASVRPEGQELTLAFSLP